MRRTILIAAAAVMAAACASCAGGGQEQPQAAAENQLAAQANPRATTASGVVEGVNESGVAVFKGVPFAAPPVGELRWRAPQPPQSWEGVRDAKDFGPNPMQRPLFGDMDFGSTVMSEDCLYLNIWTPATSVQAKLPVFIYFNGGGLLAGAGSEPRYAGMSLARNGIVAITANYREDVFGFFAHPELTAESGYGGSGNYGFLDQAAAIKWVKENIAAFGGDPDRITIMGESAGSISVSALMASPLSRELIAQAMGSSGSIVATTVQTLEQAEAEGLEAQTKAGCGSMAELRALPAEQLLALIPLPGMPTGNIDNYFFTEQPCATFKSGRQAQVPCLIGNNSAEGHPGNLCGSDLTRQGLKEGLKRWTGADDADADSLLALYGVDTDADVTRLPGYAMGGDRFIVFGTWKWMDAQQASSGAPVYRYRFCKARPRLVDSGKVSALAGGTRQKAADEQEPPATPGAAHSVDIEYQMGNIPTTPVYEWTAADFAVSEVFKTFFVNFIKTGDPNGLGVPHWDPINGEEVPPVMVIGETTGQERDPVMQRRYRLLDKYLGL